MKKTIVQVETNPFPLSAKRSIDGNRRLAREKVLQILTAYETIEANRARIFEHIFFRDFNLNESPERDESAPHHTEQREEEARPLRPEEVVEMESDIPIHWREKDVEFARILLDKAIQLTPQIDEMVERLAQNWELERIALIDRQLLRMSLAEMIAFVDIPTKVTINEAIELAKRYSTDKSNVFINGILDAARDEMVASGKIVKEGRGLDDPKNPQTKSDEK